MRKEVVFSIIAFTLFLAVPASAAEVSATEAAAPQPSKFKINIMGVAQSNLYELDSPHHEAEGQLWLSPSYQVSENYSLGLLVVATKLFQGEEKADVPTANLSLRRKGIQFNPVFSLAPGVIARLPSGYDARERQSYRGGASISPRLNYNFSGLKLGKITGFYDPTFTKNFHQYTTSTTGQSNTEYSLSHWVRLSYSPDASFLNRFGITLDFIRSSAWTYKRNIKGSFEFSQELGFDVSDAVNVAVGHSNSGNVLAADGSSSNVALFNENASTVYGSLSLTF